jgi:ABC-type phosphate/phosphonate transport system substrate-binding protein
MVAGVSAALLFPGGCRQAADATSSPLTVIVMDPLALPLSCPCVDGYAQRRYDALATFLKNRVGTDVTLIHTEHLGEVPETRLRGSFVIGKHGVVRADAAALRIDVVPIAALTDLAGATTLRGLFVVRSGDSATSVDELAGRRVLLGREESPEKSSAARAALSARGVSVTLAPTSAASCVEAACAVVEEKVDAAVISGYAKPLMEGCGQVDRGALRVIGQTAPVPFVTVFAFAPRDRGQVDAVVAALESVREDPALCRQLESKIGFVPLDR